MSAVLVHLHRVDVLSHPFVLWIGAHLAFLSGDKDNCWQGALAAGVEILLDVGLWQGAADVAKAAGSGV